MHYKVINKINYFSKWVQKKVFNQQDREDCISYATEVILKRYKNKKTVPTNNNLLIDFLRSKHDSRCKNFHLKREIYMPTYDVNNACHHPTVYHHEQNKKVNLEDKIDNSELFKKCESYLEGYYRILFFLKYVYEFTNKDISIIFGVHNSAVSLSNKVLKKKLKKHIKV